MDVVSQIQEMAELDLNDPVFKTDSFMVYGFKVLPCRRTRRHDWRECPFAHPGEVARRRDPRLYTYVGIICPDAKQNSPCPRGDNCPYTHSLFEYWLHPTRYKTEFCSRGRQCTRPFCFFAHSETEVRPVDTDALLAVAMTTTPQINQQQSTPPPPLLDVVAQTADLLQKTNFFPSPLRSLDLAPQNLASLHGNLNYVKQPMAQSLTGASTQDLMLYPSDRALTTPPPMTGNHHHPFREDQLLIPPEGELSWESRRRLSSNSEHLSLEAKDRVSSTDEILSRLGAGYLQSARRSYSQGTPLVGSFRDTPPSPPPYYSVQTPNQLNSSFYTTPSHSVLHNQSRSCKSFDTAAGLLEPRLHLSEAQVTSSASEFLTEGDFSASNKLSLNRSSFYK